VNRWYLTEPRTETKSPVLSVQVRFSPCSFSVLVTGPSCTTPFQWLAAAVGVAVVVVAASLGLSFGCRCVIVTQLDPLD
jgi:hypothetical protein